MKSEECKFTSKINAFLDKELSVIEQAEMQNHLSSCFKCQAELRELSQINKCLTEWKEAKVPEAVYSSILKQTESVPARSIRFRHKLSNFAVAASVLFAFMMGIVLSNDMLNKSIYSQESEALLDESFDSYALLSFLEED